MTCALMSSEAEFEHGEQADRAGADDHRVGLDRSRLAGSRVGHACIARCPVDGVRRRSTKHAPFRSMLRRRRSTSSELLRRHAHDEAVELRRHLDLAGQPARLAARRRRSRACPLPSSTACRSSPARPRRRRRGRSRRRRRRRTRRRCRRMAFSFAASMTVTPGFGLDHLGGAVGLHESDFRHASSPCRIEIGGSARNRRQPCSVGSDRQSRR